MSAKKHADMRTAHTLAPTKKGSCLFSRSISSRVAAPSRAAHAVPALLYGRTLGPGILFAVVQPLSSAVSALSSAVSAGNDDVPDRPFLHSYVGAFGRVIVPDGFKNESSYFIDYDDARPREPGSKWALASDERHQEVCAWMEGRQCRL
jgi:hypothetical protein